VKYEGNAKNSNLPLDIRLLNEIQLKKTYETPTGAGSRAVAPDGADEGTV